MECEMLDRLNLNSLRIFECAARLNSFTRAADELGVTQSAVSKQINALEAQFEKPLFNRFHRRVELTAFGEQVAEAASASFSQLQEKLETINDPRPHQIRFYGDADFVQLWLFTKLPEFEEANPDVRISIRSRVEMNEPPEGRYDCAIIWGKGNWEKCRFEPFLTNNAFPVARPGFFDHLARAPLPGDISDKHLIHDQTRFWWSAFQEASGAREFDPRYGRLYNQTVLCLEAASRGDGVTIGDEVSTQKHLEDGRLYCPFTLSIPSSNPYYLVTPPGGPHNEQTIEFIRWLHEKADQHRRWFADFRAR